MGVIDQHYIPKFYLKGFTDKDKNLWVYEKHKPLRQSKPKDEANRPDYYSLTESEQDDKDAVEHALSRIESLAAPIVRKLVTPQYVLTPENAADLLLFIAFMFARVPAWRENLDKVAAQTTKRLHVSFARNKEAFHRICSQVARDKGSEFSDFEGLRELVLADDYELIQMSSSFNLGAMMTSGANVAKIIAEFGYRALYAPAGKSFFTSDSPVFTVAPDNSGVQRLGMGFDWPQVSVIFPLNKRACLYLERGIEPQARLADAHQVDEINRLTMMTATNYLYSSERSRRTSRLFDERGCIVRAGKNAFMTNGPPPEGWRHGRKAIPIGRNSARRGGSAGDSQTDLGQIAHSTSDFQIQSLL
jgi:hypothetical protein